MKKYKAVTNTTLTINSSPPSAAYVRQWIGSALVQIMACCLFSFKPLSKPALRLNWTLMNILHWNFNQNTKLFLHNNAPENIICEMAAILSSGRWVNYTGHLKHQDSMNEMKPRSSFQITQVISPTEKYSKTSLKLSLLTHWGRDQKDAISQTTLSIAFSWMKMLEFRSNFHWSLFLRVQLTIFQHWFR